MTVYTIALVNPEGEIWHWYHPTATVDPEGEEISVGGVTSTRVHITEYHKDLMLWIRTHYRKNNEWVERADRDSSYYTWANETWTLNSEALFSEIRNQRNKRLSDSDWTQAADSPLTDAKKAEWVTYRAGLREVPVDNSTVTELAEVIWPDQPS